MDTNFARQQMVDQQVRAWDVLDPDILQVLTDVPREQFVPTGYEALAFADTEIPIGHGESMMTPTIEGRLLQALAPQEGERVLEIGTGSGFLTACLARLTGNVTSIDIHDDFIEQAQASLADTGINGVTLLQMDATQELPHGKFDVIAVTASVEAFEPRFVEALAPGGRLFVVVGKAPAMDALLVTKTGDNEWQSESLFETVLRPLTDPGRKAEFLF
ncbi:MAG: protein-L-isoaspartate O-methyltransferase [Woeseiaceae bacterium]|jgi:protein-L-isoaspartate(D-aspartate) O-methyltransferase